MTVPLMVNDGLGLLRGEALALLAGKNAAAPITAPHKIIFISFMFVYPLICVAGFSVV
jgi:hypothetical protein